ncbi:hypothetical protein BDV96DRAFT_562632 [Lophiotrema nucula]|uniref:Uncharacterized protein n=1 Tax=Lophiotrema nucula TaxID=690887 RepID=A0A6A5ZSE9_9PLEO|nr:hypothetical protein BDV96DRAFT_562632 [Lophiotrema nucula]
MPVALQRRLATCSGLLRRSLSDQTRRSPTSTSTNLKGNQLGPTIQEDHQSFRVRKDGAPLPLPPLLDPIVLEERSRWEQPKAKPDASTLTPFQRKLLANPYAHALASPVRECRATHHFFPSALLTTLHPRPHPETSDLWLLPVSLTTSKKQLGVPYRFLSRRVIADYLGKKRSWRQGVYQRMREKLGSGTEELVWREDMPDLILRLLRTSLMGKLRWYFNTAGRLVPVPSPRTEDIEGVEDVSCVLFFGSLKTRADEIRVQVDREVAADDSLATSYANSMKRVLDPLQAKGIRRPSWWMGPVVPRLKPRIRYPELDFKTTQYKGRKVAVYSLEDLLGDENVKELVRGSKVEGERCVVMKTARHNVPTEILLMQLQVYLASPGP